MASWYWAYIHAVDKKIRVKLDITGPRSDPMLFKTDRQHAEEEMWAGNDIIWAITPYEWRSETYSEAVEFARRSFEKMGYRMKNDSTWYYVGEDKHPRFTKLEIE